MTGLAAVLVAVQPPSARCQPLQTDESSLDDAGTELLPDSSDAAEPALVVSAALAAESPPAADSQAIQVLARSTRLARSMEDSAQAVQVIELEQAQLETGDLGTVVARAPGVSVRRTGGMGSDTRFSLNGMQGDQVRFFLDGIPLEYMGYTFGIANLPVNLVSRLEVYSGVVPIRFGADALGGAVNLVSEESLGESGASLSYQYGSFATHRATTLAQRADVDSGLFARVEAFYDDADNDYDVDVLEPNASGREVERRVPRFHDAYRAHGVAVEAGVTRLPWASRLSLRGFVAGHHKQIQTDRAMAVPYGEAETQDSSLGALLRYRVSLGESWSLSTQTGYNQLDARFIDLTSCVYDWLGECVRTRKFLGELSEYVGKNGADQRTRQSHLFNRSSLSFHATDWLALNLAIAATNVHQTGQDVRLESSEYRDPLKTPRDLFTLINGLEGRIDVLDDALQGIAFAKQYFQALDSLEGHAGEDIRDVSRGSHHLGAGALVRYRFSDWLLAKASYEWATRLPEPVEVFGDNSEIIDNPRLKPERSHNYNLEATLRAEQTTWGDWSLSVLGFLRDVHDLIMLIPNSYSRFSQFRNLYATRVSGVTSDVQWTSPGDHVSVSGNVTSQRNVATSSNGPFGYLEGKRLPNRPSLFGNASLAFQLSDVFQRDDRMFSSLYLNWIDSFYLGWEGVGAEEYKQSIPSQLTLQIALGY